MKTVHKSVLIWYSAEEMFALVSETENAVLHQLSPAELLLLSELLDRMYAVCVAEDGGEAVK